MRTILSWSIKLSAVGLFYVAMASGMKVKLPEVVFGYKVPASAQAWVDRNAQIADYGQRTQAALKGIGDSFK
jgi:hypothetical protein